jgi:hypothetical protein
MLAVLLAQAKLRGMEEISDGLERAGKASGSLLLLRTHICATTTAAGLIGRWILEEVECEKGFKGAPGV